MSALLRFRADRARIERVRYTAEEYDLIEALTAAGAPDDIIGARLVPPVTGPAIGLARRRAGISGRRRGRLGREERARWRGEHA